jgi:hypothetical protein
MKKTYLRQGSNLRKFFTVTFGAMVIMLIIAMWRLYTLVPSHKVFTAIKNIFYF